MRCYKSYQWCSMHVNLLHRAELLSSNDGFQQLRFLLLYCSHFQCSFPKIKGCFILWKHQFTLTRLQSSHPTLTFPTILCSQSSCPTHSMFLVADRLALYFVFVCWQLFVDNSKMKIIWVQLCSQQSPAVLTQLSLRQACSSHCDNHSVIWICD